MSEFAFLSVLINIFFVFKIQCFLASKRLLTFFLNKNQEIYPNIKPVLNPIEVKVKKKVLLHKKYAKVILWWYYKYNF